MAELSNYKQAPLLSEREAEKYAMSICIYADGLAFFIAASDSSSVIFSDRLFFQKESTLLFDEQLSELIYSHPFLTFPYKNVSVTYLEEHFILIPPGIVVEGVEESWVSSTLTPRGDGVGYVATYPISEYGVQLLSCWMQKAYSFLKRTYPYSPINPFIVRAIQEAIDKSRKSVQLYFSLLLGSNSVDLIATYKGNILLANKFQLISSLDCQAVADEILFYVGSSINALTASHSVEVKAVELFYREECPSEEMQKVGDALQKNITSIGLDISRGIAPME